MARPEVTGRKQLNSRPEVPRRKPLNAADDADAYSVDEFCSRHRISPQLFYKLKPQGLMPVTFNVGARVLISKESAAAWRSGREAASDFRRTVEAEPINT
jgi:hypothetical protein